MVPDARCYLRFRKLRHPADMGAAEIDAFPWYLSNEKDGPEGVRPVRAKNTDFQRRKTPFGRESEARTG